MMDNKGPKETILKQVLEIIYLLTGDHYILVKKHSKHIRCNTHPCVTEEVGEPSWDVMETLLITPISPTLEDQRSKNEKIVKNATNIIHLLHGQVPVQCDDIAVFFSLEEWQFLNEQKELYKDVMQNCQTIHLLGPCESRDEDMEEFTDQTLQPEDPLIEGSESCDPDHYEIPPTLSKCPSPRRPSVGSPSNADPSSPSSPAKALQSEGSESCDPDHYEIPPTLSKCPSPRRPSVRSTSTADPAPSPPSSPAKALQSKNSLIKNIQNCDLDNNKSPPEDALCPSPEISLRNSKTVSSQEKSVALTSNGRRVHAKISTNEKLFKCTICGKLFVRACDLADHEKIHGNRPYNCGQCGKSFRDARNLAFHARTHSKERPHVCSVCGKSFRSKFSLLNHTRIHTGEKPHVCDKCDKAFTNRSNLLSHLLVHSVNKKHKCPDCGKTFRHNGILILHYRVHTGERPYKCQECGQCFSSSSNLDSHMIYHTGNKRFECSKCGKKFRHKIALLKHQKPHNETGDDSCKEGSQLTQDRQTLSGDQLQDLNEHRKTTGLAGDLRPQLKDKPDTAPKRAERPIAPKPQTLIGTKQRESKNLGETLGENPQITRDQTLAENKPKAVKNPAERRNLTRGAKCLLGDKMHHCPTCDKTFTEKSQLLQHQETNAKDGQRGDLKCGMSRALATGAKQQLPDKASKRSEMLVENQPKGRDKKPRSGDKMYPCSKCSATFTENSQLIQHRQTHGADKEDRKHKGRDLVTDPKRPKCDETIRGKSPRIQEQQARAGDKQQGVKKSGKSRDRAKRVKR